MHSFFGAIRRSKFLKNSAAAAAFLALVMVFTITEARADDVVLAQGQTFVSRDYQVQNFQDWLKLRPNQEKLPLTLVIYNGNAHEAPGFKWFRLQIGGYMVATEKNLGGQEEGTVNVGGVINPGDSQVMLEAAGVPGASFTWRLLTPRIQVTGMNPNVVKPGDTVTITGANFSANAAQNIVYFNNQPGKVLQSSPTSLTVQVPQNANSGVAQVQVNVDNNTSRVCEFTIGGRPVPELLSIDCWMAPPGGQITITGHNFSVNQNSNKVFFSNVQANIISSSQTQLVVEVPNWAYGPSQLNIPVTVVVDGVRSGNALPFDIGPSYHGAIPHF